LKLYPETKTSLLLNKIHLLLPKLGVESYLVGGFVRDALLGRDTADIDIAVATDTLVIIPKLADKLGGKCVILDEINKICRIIISEDTHRWEIDFSTFRDTIEQDLARRDFTIDAMAIDLSQLDKGNTDYQVIDPFNGLDDLHKSIIRMVSEDAFQSDPARLLRAVRLAAELGFGIETRTEALIRRYSYLLTRVAGAG